MIILVLFVDLDADSPELPGVCKCSGQQADGSGGRVLGYSLEPTEHTCMLASQLLRYKLATVFLGRMTISVFALIFKLLVDPVMNIQRHVQLFSNIRLFWSNIYNKLAQWRD